MPSIRLAELHPILVHFPIALLLTSVALDFLAVIFRRASLIEGATWTLVLGAPSAVIALGSGWLSEHDVSAAAAPDLLHLHKVCAVLATAIFGILFLVRLIWQAPRLLGWMYMMAPSISGLASARGWLVGFIPIDEGKPLPRAAIALYLLLGVAGIALLALTGYLGGAMVYDYGVGLPVR